MQRNPQQTEIPNVKVSEIFELTSTSTGIRMVVEWYSPIGIICDLDLCVLLFDERARLIQKLTFDQPLSIDKSITMEGDINANSKGSSHEENVHIDLSSISSNICAIFILIDGGQRNFQHVQRLVLTCYQENLEKDHSNFMNKVNPTLFASQILFQCTNKTKKDFEGVAHSILFRDGWDTDNRTSWKFKCIYEPLYTKSMKEKDDICNHLTITTVPSLELYKPRLFPNVKSLTAALSSSSLPALKDKFQSSGGLDSIQFTETLFRALLDIQPKLQNLTEAASTIAALQDMFSQIDYNSDGTIDWDELTTFCIQIGLNSNDSRNHGSDSVLDKYVVEYTEDGNVVDNVIKSHSQLGLMKYFPTLNRIVTMLEKGESILMLNEQFKLHSVYDPSRSHHSEHQEKIKIYDVCYLTIKDLYAYCASDHTIVILKEQASLNGKRISYSAYKKLFSNMLHVKLCWSDRCQILCSVASDNLVYGWNLDEQNPIFQVSRHKDTITDFLSIDSMELFATCSLDRRIVLWSQSTRRVKGALIGHKRGIRFMSYLRGTLLSAGFECEARTWDVTIREPTLILRGHRAPIAAGKIMCPEGDSIESLRAITVDDNGEFRLWNIYVKEKGSDPVPAQVLQTFSAHNSHIRFDFIELPFNPQYSIGAYSNIIAASTKLIHFVPEKNTAEFIPPKALCYSEPNNCLVTAIGRSLFKYDVFTGSFTTSHLNITNSDITSMSLDEYYGRRVYLGCANGSLLLINFATAAIIDSIVVHSKDILAIAVIKSSNHNMVFTGSLDGRIRYLEETSGTLMLHTTADQPIGDSCGIAIIRGVPSLKILAVASTGLYWGLFYALTFKRICLIEEPTTIASLEVLSASGDSSDIEEHNSLGLPLTFNHLVSLAVCLSNQIKIYTIDTLRSNIAHTHTLLHSPALNLSDLLFFQISPRGCINYTPTLDSILSKHEELLIAISDEGFLILWDAKSLRKDTKSRFYSYYQSPTENNGHIQHKQPHSGILGTEEYIPDEGQMNIFEEEGFQVFDEDEDYSTSDHCLGVKLPCLSPSQSKKRRLATFTKNHKSMSQFILDTQNTQIKGVDSVLTLTSIRSYHLHTDMITTVIPLIEHGCLITCSLDGYQRVLNLDGECLGEMPLPNLTEKMKEKSLHLHWKFLLEKLPVKDSHRDIATKLLRSINEGRNGSSTNGKHARRFGQINLNHTTSFGEKLVKRTLANAEDNSLGMMYQSVERNDRTEKMFKEVEDERLRRSVLSTIKNPYRKDEFKKPTTDQMLGSRRMSVNQVHSIWYEPSVENPPVDPLSPENSSHLPRLDSALDDQSLTSRSMLSRKSGRNRELCSPSRIPWNRVETLIPHHEPFSEHSIASSHQEGLIDSEGHQILRRVNYDRQRKEIFSRSVPQVLLKDIPTSSNVEVPKLEGVIPSEILFGDQKEMYKNANTFYAEKKISRQQAQHTISISRIKQNIRKIGPMIQLVSTPIAEIGELSQPDIQPSAFRLTESDSQNPVELPSVDEEKLASLIKKVEEATSMSHSHWEKLRDRSSIKKTLLRTTSSIRTNVDVLETKLLVTIKSHYKNNSLPSPTDMKILNTRALLPYYKLVDVKHFLDAFQKVDEDYSGDLDINEWCNFLTSFNKSLSKQNCRTIFHRVDKKGEGVLSVRELIPVVFSHANKDQQALITKYMEIELSKRKTAGKDLINENDLRKLFEYYDEESLGFISVDFLREKIKHLGLPEHATEFLLGKIQSMDSDEMLNPSDFVRVFYEYISS